MSRRSADALLLATTIIPFRPHVARLMPRSSQRLQSFRHCEPAGFPSLRASRRGNLSLPSLNDLARLPRRLADASLLATTIIFPSLRAIFRPSLRASRLSVIASQPAFRHCEPAGVAISPPVSLRASRFSVIASQPAWQSPPSVTQ